MQASRELQESTQPSRWMLASHQTTPLNLVIDSTHRLKAPGSAPVAVGIHTKTQIQVKSKGAQTLTRTPAVPGPPQDQAPQPPPPPQPPPQAPPSHPRQRGPAGPRRPREPHQATPRHLRLGGVAKSGRSPVRSRSQHLLLRHCSHMLYRLIRTQLHLHPLVTRSNHEQMAEYLQPTQEPKKRRTWQHLGRGDHPGG